MDIWSSETTLGELKKLPGERVVFLVCALEFANELSFLIKALVASTPMQDQPSDWQDVIASSQATFYAKLAAGKLHEFWKQTKTIYSDEKIREAYHDRMGVEAQEAFQRLESYFSNPKNEISLIRHNLAFHSGPKTLAKTISSLAPDTPCRLIAAPHYTNTFFEFAAGVNNRSLIAILAAGQYKTVLDFIHHLLVPRLMDALKFSHGFGVAILESLPRKDLSLGSIEAVKMDDLSLPFFTEK